MFSKLNYTFLFLSILVCFSNIYAQENFRPIIKDYDFGKAYFVGENKIDNYRKKFQNEGIVNNKGQYTSFKKVYSHKEFDNLLTSKEITSIYLLTPSVPNRDEHTFAYPMIAGTIKPSINIWYLRINHFLFVDATILKLFNFVDMRMKGMFTIMNSEFNDIVIFNGCKFNPELDTINFIYDTQFRFESSLIKDELHITNSTFNMVTFFSGLIIKGESNFNYTKFNKLVRFGDVKFEKNFNLEFVDFNQKVDFHRVTFKDSLNLFKATFKEGADFRRCNFDSVSAIYLEGCEYPNGKFYVDWKDIKYRDKPIISIHQSNSKNEIDDFKRFENIYDQLIDNYVAQGNRISADDVRYELEVRKQELLGGFTHWLYGITFGYGFQPFRIIAIALIIFLFFSFYFYWKHYIIMYNMFSTENVYYQEKPVVQRIPKGKLLKNYKVVRFSILQDIPKLVIIWHCIILSASLLFGLRFKKDWVREDSKSFLFTATLEWFLGACLYLYFVLGIKTFRFEFLKGIFGI